MQSSFLQCFKNKKQEMYQAIGHFQTLDDQSFKPKIDLNQNSSSINKTPVHQQDDPSSLSDRQQDTLPKQEPPSMSFSQLTQMINL